MNNCRLNEKKIIDKLYLLIRETFNLNSEFLLFDNMWQGHVPGWDSLGGVNLINAVQQEFNIKFSLEEMSRFNSIKDIKEIIENYISD